MFDLSRRAPALQRITNGIGIASLSIIAAPYVADMLADAIAREALTKAFEKSVEFAMKGNKLTTSTATAI